MLDTLAMAEKLHGEYRESFERADVYGVMAGGDEYEDKMMNLYDLLLEAELEGKSVEKIIGRDIEQFCKSYFEREKKSLLTTLPEKLYGILKIVFIFTLIDLFLLQEEGEGFRAVNTDLSPIITGLLIGFVMLGIGEIIKRTIFKTKKIKPILYYGVITIIFIVLIVLSIIFIDAKISMELTGLPVVIISGFYTILYFIIRSIQRYKATGTIWSMTREEKKAKKQFNKEVSDESLKIYSAMGMASRFKRFQKKWTRKGKGEYTQADFAAKVRKEEVFVNKLDYWMILIFAAIIIVPAAGEMINNSVVEGLILGAILAVVEIPIYIFTSKMNRENSVERLDILDECEERGITIVEYYEEMKAQKGK